MMKSEFDALLSQIQNKQIVSNQCDYDIIEVVYTYYPDKDGNAEIITKKDYANLYNTFGIRIFEAMLPLAEQIKEKTETIQKLQLELKKLKKIA